MNMRRVGFLAVIVLLSACGGGSDGNTGGRQSSSTVRSSSISSTISSSLKSSSSPNSLATSVSSSSLIVENSSVASVGSSSSSSIASSSSTSSAVQISPPENITLISGYAQITVNWTAVLGAVSYNIYYAKESFSTISDIVKFTNLAGSGVVGNITTTYQTLGGLENNSTYYLVITASNVKDEESVMSAEHFTIPASIVTPTPIPTPTPTATPIPTGETIACTLKSEGGACDALMPEKWSGTAYALENVNAAGKTFCMQPNVNIKGILVENVTGAENAPVTITNCGGKLTLDTSGWQTAINVLNSQYIHITGTGSADNFYGIHVVNSGGAGVDATYGTSDFEVDHVQIDNAGGSGIIIRTYPFADGCHLEWARPNFTQYNTVVHDNYINGAQWEGLYIGTSHYDQENGVTGTSCGDQSSPQPSLVGVEIYNNRIENIGYDGIQIGGGISGVEVYNNTVRNFALLNNEYHSGGLQLNSGTSGVFYNNFIQAHTDADVAQGLMYVGGEGAVYVYNNVFVGGDKAVMTLNRMENNTQFFYTNNTYYGRGTGDTFYFFCDHLPNIQQYIFKNNIFTEYATIGTNVTTKWGYFNGSNGANCPINGSVMTAHGESEEDIHMSNNYFSKLSDELIFVNPSAGNYSLSAGSPAVGMGANLSIILPSPKN